jgi:hypothetical protein
MMDLRNSVGSLRKPALTTLSVGLDMLPALLLVLFVLSFALGRRLQGRSAIDAGHLDGGGLGWLQRGGLLALSSYFSSPEFGRRWERRL